MTILARTLRIVVLVLVIAGLYLLWSSVTVWLSWLSADFGIENTLEGKLGILAALLIIIVIGLIGFAVGFVMTEILHFKPGSPSSSDHQSVRPTVSESVTRTLKKDPVEIRSAATDGNLRARIPKDGLFTSLLKPVVWALALVYALLTALLVGLATLGLLVAGLLRGTLKLSISGGAEESEASRRRQSALENHESGCADAPETARITTASKELRKPVDP